MITRLVLAPPTSYRGIEALVPPELKQAFIEIARRLDVNTKAQNDALSAQILVDTDLTPTAVSGAAATSTLSVGTTLDDETQFLFSTLWEGTN